MLITHKYTHTHAHTDSHTHYHTRMNISLYKQNTYKKSTEELIVGVMETLNVDAT